MTLELANRAIFTPDGIARDVFVPVGKFTFPADFVVVDYKSDPRVPLILGRPFLRISRALIDVHGEEMILRDGDERLTLNMKHDTASYSNHPHRESVNLINIFNLSSEDCLEVLVSHKQSGNPTFSLHKEIASPEVIPEFHDSKGCNFLSEELPDIDSFNDIHPYFDDDPLSGGTTYSANSLLEEFAGELALITYPLDYDDNHACDIESDIREIEFLLYHGEDSDFKDSVDQSVLANCDDLFFDPTPEMFTDEQPPDYSFPSRFDVYLDDFLEIESDANFNDDSFDSEGEKIKEVELLIDQLDLPCDILSEYDSFNSQDFSRDDVLPTPDNEDKVFNPRILIHEKSVLIITRVTQEKKLVVSFASWLFEDFDTPFYELFVFKEVPNSMRLLPFSSKNEEKVFKPGIYTSKKFHCCFLSELSHPEQIPSFNSIVRAFASLGHDLVNAVRHKLTTAVMVNAVEEQLQALVDRKKVIITEATIIRDLQLEDAEGVNCLPNAEIFEKLTLMELREYEQILNNRVFDLENIKTAQAQEIDSLKRRVKKLENRQKSKTHGLKRMYKVGLSARVESFDEEILGEEDASKHGRNIADIDTNKKITLVDKTIEDQGRFDDQEMFDTGLLYNEEVVVEKTVTDKEVSVVEEVNDASIITPVSAAAITTIAAATTPTISMDERTLAKALIEIKTSWTKAKGIVMQEPSETPIPTPIVFFQQPSNVHDKRLQAEFDEDERLARDKNKANNAVIEQWNDVQAKIKTHYELSQRLQEEEQEQLTDDKKARLFMQFLEKRKKFFAAKRAKEKRNRPPTIAQQRKLKRCLEIVPADGDAVTIDATPLSFKSPTIINYKIYKEGRKIFFQISKADVMSDYEDSTITYTAMSSPFRGLSDIGSPGVDGPPVMPEYLYAYLVAAFQASPSPDYVSGPEHPPPPVYVPEFVPEPVYPEFMPAEDDILLAEEEPLPAAASLTTESPGYIDEDPKVDPEK
nr:reverse transcriptase domain-containing protein [Tanacetum cinerariifolium]